MATQVLLEVQDRQLVILLEREELAERRIGIDGLLVHELVLLAVGGNSLGDIGAADLGVLGLTQEGKKLIRDCDRGREDAGLGGCTLHRGLAVLALALSLLGEAARELLDGLQVGHLLSGVGLGEGHQLMLAGHSVGKSDSDVLLNSGDSRLRGDSGGYSHRGSHRGRGCSSNRGLLLLARLDRSSNDRGGDNNSDRSFDGGLGRLLGSLGDRGGGAHFGYIGGRIGRHGTRMYH